MGRVIDLVGKKYGRLRVIKRAKDDILPSGQHRRMWLCKCNCGKEKIIAGIRLYSKETKSCGCLRTEKLKNRFKNIVGKKFGKLLVRKRIENYISKNGRARLQYLCLCKCGKMKKVRGEDLRSGHTKSCGCIGGNRKVNDLTGYVFGKLIVINLDHINKSAYWKCRCECGNEPVIFGGNLKKGKSKSCGCCQSESLIASKVKEYFSKKYDCKTEYKKFKNPISGYYLPFDLYLNDKRIFIEIHGEQHYILSGWHKMKAKRNGTSPEEEFKYQRKLDRMKRKYARKNGTYIEVNLLKIKSVESAIQYAERQIERSIF